MRLGARHFSNQSQPIRREECGRDLPGLRALRRRSEGGTNYLDAASTKTGSKKARAAESLRPPNKDRNEEGNKCFCKYNT